MDLLTFLAELVKALAWPGTLLGIAFLFKEQLRGLLTRIRRGAFGGAEVEFELGVRELEQMPTVGEDATVTPPELSLSDATEDRLRAAVLRAWRTVQQSALELLDHAGYDRTLFPSQIAVALREIGPPEDADLFLRLTHLKYGAEQTAPFSPGPEAVRSYVSHAEGLAHRLYRRQHEVSPRKDDA